ncbi:ribose-phosphate pyrophosphokinase [Brevibacillus laterosporus]|uniref:hypothetical protein n=1 Tax=Brevibacillus laterosporus TaxID=1465 RepID=UPI00036ECE06|nr:hypothetical protein [Brevibacillus laterosporus]ATO48638.1 ribose-phosphate pyrophosphokinase [Brevibacillus laterosporus DSM 25]MED2002478.1 ribose-phosphate pyrophosphokinase [Brevibacillus laterosporus]
MIKLNGTPLNFKVFPNGETLVDGEQIIELLKFKSREVEVEVTLKYENDSDLLKLLFVKSFLDSYYFTTNLTIAYMPYSRMDRVEGNSVFTLKYVANMINGMNFEYVTVIEPHSDVTMALLDRSVALYPTTRLLHEVMADLNFDIEKDYLFFPDQGAQKRYGKHFTKFKQLVGFKERDFKTGQIDKLQLVGSVEGKGFKAIIVDDLCSYGNTFIRSSNALRDVGADKVYLLVTHAEDSIFKGSVFTSDLIDKVYTTNTLLIEIPEVWESSIQVTEMI